LHKNPKIYVQKIPRSQGSIKNPETLGQLWLLLTLIATGRNDTSSDVWYRVASSGRWSQHHPIQSV